MSKITIHDANIFIDIIKLGLLIYLVKLNTEIHTTDFVLEELKEEQFEELKRFIENGLIIVKTFKGDELEILTEVEELFPLLSPTDCSIMHYAKDISAILITGDNHLRKTAEEFEIEVHGILWVFDKFVEEEIISKSFAIDKLEELM